MIAYRDARAEDAAALGAFARDTFVETFGHLYPPEDLATHLSRYAPEILRAEIADAQTRYRLAFDGHEMVGYCKVGGDFDLPVERSARAVELHRLYVHRRVKGAGVAQALMDDALDWARAQGADQIFLSVWEKNHRAQAFYRRYSFEHVGEHSFMVGRTADHDFIWRAAL